jgi:hypothetical protein
MPNSISDTKADVDMMMKKINSGEVAGSDFFGTREFLEKRCRNLTHCDHSTTAKTTVLRITRYLISSYASMAIGTES